MHDTHEEERRTSALAYWRYGHEYLRAAGMLSARLRLPTIECQPVYHLCAQALEFALKAYLRANGVEPPLLVRDYTGRIDRALGACDRAGLALGSETRRVIAAVDPHHAEDGFRAVTDAPDAFPDFAPLFDATCVLLDVIVPTVAAQYLNEHAEPGSPDLDAFVRRLRADLSATRSEHAQPA